MASDVAKLLHEINVGHVRFAWLPVKTHEANGLIYTGWVWLKPYRRLRCIGFPIYYNERIALTGQGREGEEG